MQCTAILGFGVRCGREAKPGAELCAFHRSIEFRREARPFYLARLWAEDQKALPVAAQLEGVDAEIAVLRVLLRRAAGDHRIDAFRRGVETLCRILQTKHNLDRRGTDRLGDTLDAVLESLGRELKDEEPDPEDEAFPPPPAADSRINLPQVPWSPSPLTAPPSWLSALPTPAREVEAVELVLRYQGGEPEALELLHGLLEVAILAILLHYRASQPPSAWTWEELLERGRIVLAELVQRWRPGGSFLAYFYRAFPSAIARYSRQRQSGARGQGPGIGDQGPEEGSQASGLRPPTSDRASEASSTPAPEPPTGSSSEGPFSAAALATLPELERQIVLLRVFEGQSLRAIARQVGLDWSVTYRLYERARARLEGRFRQPDWSGSIAMRRLVQALHSAAGPDRRMPGRNWAMSASGLKRREYEQLMGKLEGAGAIRKGGHGGRGYLLDRTAAATLARVGISDEGAP